MRDGSLSSRGVDNLARMSVAGDSRARRVNEVTNRYYRNIDKAGIVDDNQQISRRVYMGNNGG